jgi:hypothetical protein
MEESEKKTVKEMLNLVVIKQKVKELSGVG